MMVVSQIIYVFYDIRIGGQAHAGINVSGRNGAQVG